MLHVTLYILYWNDQTTQQCGGGDEGSGNMMTYIDVKQVMYKSRDKNNIEKCYDNHVLSEVQNFHHNTHQVG